MATLTPEAPAQTQANEAKSRPNKRERLKRPRRGRTEESGARYFLVKGSSVDKMELGEEAASESEAMVTAFRTGGSFAAVTEWKTGSIAESVGRATTELPG